MNRKLLAPLLAISLATGAVATTAFAQTADGDTAATADRDHDGFDDWGLLGLLGLLGLIPRRRHDTHVHTDAGRPRT